MKLLQAIQQSKPFKDAREHVVVNIKYTHSWLVNEQKKHLDCFGITEKQYNILRILKGSDDSLSTADIRDRMIDKMSDVSRIVDRMDSKQLVKKSSRPEDRRKINVTITEQGIALLEKMNKEVIGEFQNMINLDQNEADTLNKLLDKLRS